jgi:hypothetical protein
MQRIGDDSREEANEEMQRDKNPSPCSIGNSGIESSQQAQ